MEVAPLAMAMKRGRGKGGRGEEAARVKATQGPSTPCGAGSPDVSPGHTSPPPGRPRPLDGITQSAPRGRIIESSRFAS